MAEVKELIGDTVSSRQVDESAFGTRVLGRTLKDAIVMYEANARAGTVMARSRGMVHGGNKKLWPQKHTGRARMGTTKSPLWRGGGRIHPPAPRDHSYAMPKKARQAALRNALYTKFRDGEVAIASGWPAEKPNTKAAAAILGKLGILGKTGKRGSATVVTEIVDHNLCLSLRNVPLVDVRTVGDLNARQVLLRRHLVLTPAAFAALEQRYAGMPKAAKDEQPGTQRQAEAGTSVAGKSAAGKTGDAEKKVRRSKGEEGGLR
ncbi:MAG TPA: 50S ribosomal protein L4 [Planctomycetota bacterium]|nr:50S ribosomal protein L4 [Planctomycetota bacterium]